jgi:hypothetical protein
MYQADADMDKMVQEIKSGARPVSHMGEARPPSAEFEF